MSAVSGLLSGYLRTWPGSKGSQHLPVLLRLVWLRCERARNPHVPSEYAPVPRPFAPCPTCARDGLAGLAGLSPV